MVTAGAALVLALLGSAIDAAAVSARVRWLPSPDARVIGYQVYVRQAGQPYGQGIDVGSPTPDGNGYLSFVVDNLSTGTHHFTVEAYDDDGVPSRCAGELGLGPMSPCVVDWCCPGYCSAEMLPDGEPCGGDVCEVCRAGACTGAVEAALVTDALRLVLQRSGTRMTAKGLFDSPIGFDPSQTGLTLGITDASGAVLLGVNVPSSAMRASGGASFVLDRRVGVPGFRALRTRSTQGQIRLTARLTRDELNAALSQSTLAWAVRVGDTCARSSNLTCTGTSARSCR